MAGYVPNEWVARLLEATVGRTATSAGTVYLGLALTLPEDPLTATLATIQEVTTTGYARKAVPAFDAAVLGVTGMQVTTPTAFSFNALTADMEIPANYAFLTDAAAGTAGTIRYIFELAEPVLGKAGEPINIPASTLIIE